MMPYQKLTIETAFMKTNVLRSFLLIQLILYLYQLRKPTIWSTYFQMRIRKTFQFAPIQLMPIMWRKFMPLLKIYFLYLSN